MSSLNLQYYFCIFSNHEHEANIMFSCCFTPSDGETYISADDLRINLWNLEISNQSFNIVDVKPANMEDLTGKFSSVR